MTWEDVKEWFFENWRYIVGAVLLLIFSGVAYYYIQQEFNQRQIRLDNVTAFQPRDWSEASTSEVVEVMRTDSPLLLPREIVPELLERKIEVIPDLGSAIKAEEYKIPEVKRHRAPDFL